MFFPLLAAFALAAEPPDIIEPLRVGATAAGDAAVVIGVEDYAFLPAVPYAQRDAQAMAHVLLYTRGIPAEKVQLLSGGSKEQIEAAVARGRADVSEGGTLWIYFAGHGAASKETGQLMLVGDDAKRDPEVFGARSVVVDTLVHGLDVDTQVILDTCYAGVGRDGEALVPGTRFVVPSEAVHPSTERTRIWTAASPSEISAGYEPAAHGLFTYFVVGAMRGWADGELDGQKDGVVTLGESQVYVKRALATLSARGQTPVVHGDVEATLTSGRLESGPAFGSLPRTGAAAAVSAPPKAEPATPFRLPVAHLRRGLYEDAVGSAVQWTALSQAAKRSASGTAALRQHRSARIVQWSGLGVTGLGVLITTMSGSYWAQDTTEYQDSWDDNNCTFDPTNFGCPPDSDEPGPLADRLVPGLAITSAGFAVTVTSGFMKRSSKRHLVEAVNARDERR